MADALIASQEYAARKGGALLKLDPANDVGDFIFAQPSDFAPNGKIALFIHGFTANATYMRPIMKQFANNGYVVAAFNYPCYDGIDKSARRLFELLAELDSLTGANVSNNRIVIVAHSMGGLVARALVTLEDGHKYVRKVFTLGTPHDGTLINSALVYSWVSWGESLSGLVRGGFAKSSLSAKQLMRADGPNCFLDRLLNASTPKNRVVFHSFSGGKTYLTMSGNPLWERVMNLVIQGQLNDPENDGLVSEASSDLSRSHFSNCADGCVHHNNYADYMTLNHSHLCESQILGLRILTLAA